MEIVRVMTGVGPITIREVARRVGRDFKAVHSDVTMLTKAGIVDRTAGGAVEFPYDQMHVEFDVRAA
jgi:predicted transcriptional regulator